MPRELFMVISTKHADVQHLFLLSPSYLMTFWSRILLASFIPISLKWAGIGLHE